MATLSDELKELQKERQEQYNKGNMERVYVINSQIKRVEESMRGINNRNYWATPSVTKPQPVS